MHGIAVPDAVLTTAPAALLHTHGEDNDWLGLGSIDLLVVHAARPIAAGLDHHYAHGLSWKCEHRSIREIEAAAEGLSSAGDVLPTHLDLLNRIMNAEPLLGEDWHRGLKERLRDSALRELTLGQYVGLARTAIGNTTALLTRCHALDAALSARDALNATVDALLTGAGHRVASGARRRDAFTRLTESGDPLGCLLTLERYQRIQTMQGLHVGDAEAWTGSVLSLCLTILLALEAQDSLPDLVLHLESTS
ncbi:hypothetical protein OWR29_39405 [Actinoplanes sp. Pm04-4]|uniref:Uncharacterized protein n=1 Tax=Paractinoplanes pyxinae TaxID=2997416 RepID=A0ABT4BE49_9ACTN|nr:hypothetical protein [Actinoplanes pyxinae]MCY1144100.1 hypothetical protein [Actinoplanes pyxinae]